MRRSHTSTPAADLPDFDVLANAKASDPHRTHQALVAGEGQHIDVHVLHVYGNGTRGLGCVDRECHALLPANPANLSDRLNRANHIGAMVHNHQCRVGPDRSGDVVWIDKPGCVKRNKRRFDAAVAHEVVDRADHGIVFQIGGDHVIASRQQAGDRQVQRIRGVVAEAQPLGRILVTAKEAREPFAQVIEK